MILGIGTDLVNIKRIDTVLKKHSDRFITKYFNEVENESFHERPDIDTEFVEAKSEVELIVLEEWRKLLGIEKIGVNGIKIEKINQSNRKKDYREYYDESTMKKVAELYSKDINIFSYGF